MTRLLLTIVLCAVTLVFVLVVSADSGSTAKTANLDSSERSPAATDRRDLAQPKTPGKDYPFNLMAAAITITPDNDPNHLIDRLLVPGTGITITSVTYTGAATAAGLYGGGPFGIHDGIILATGDVTNALPPDTSTGTTTTFGLVGCEECNSLIPGYTSYDAAILAITFDVSDTNSSISFEFVFGSEEYPEYVGSDFNDVFGAYLNGTQIAFDPFEEPITINGPFFSSGSVQTPPTNGLEYDGSTGWLGTLAAVTPGSTNNTLLFVICDATDYQWDSGVLLARLAGSVFEDYPPEFLLYDGMECNDIVEGDSFSFQIGAIDRGTNADTVTLSVVSMPEEATMSPWPPLTGNPVISTFSWTPPAGYSSDETVTFSVTDVIGGHTEYCTLTLRTCEITLDFTSTCDDLDTVFVGETVPCTLKAVTNASGSNLSIQMLSYILPFVDFTVVTGPSPQETAVVISPTIEHVRPEPYKLKFVAMKDDMMEFKTIDFWVIPLCENPVFETFPNDVSIVEQQEFTADIVASSNTDTIYCSSCPENAEVIYSGNGQAVFRFIPDYYQANGDFDIFITAAEGSCDTTESFTVHVDAVPLVVERESGDANPSPPLPGSCQEKFIYDDITIRFNKAIDCWTVPYNVDVISRLGDTGIYPLCAEGDSYFEVVTPGAGFIPEDKLTIIIGSDVKDMNGNSKGTIDTVYKHFGPVVYPGDTDNNGVVDERDILPLGVFWNEGHGCSRLAGAGLSWQAKAAKRWNNLRATYADADGSGDVDSADICGIAENWGETWRTSTVRSSSPFDPQALGETGHDVIQKLYAALEDCDNAAAGSQRLREMLAAAMSQPEEENLPSEYMLSQNYPNPFNPNTAISFYVPQPCHVRLSVYNIMGQEVSVLVDGRVPSGYGEVVWDGTDHSGHAVGSGVYFYRLTAGDRTMTKRMMLLK